MSFKQNLNQTQDSGLTGTSWNDEMRLAQQGDTKALCNLCAGAEPVIDQLCATPLFAGRLGRDETRSIASLALIEFFLSYRGHTPDREMPHLLKRVLRDALCDSLRKLKVRGRFEMIECCACHSGAPPEENPVMESLPGDSAEEPENKLLQAELLHDVRNALQHLSEREQFVIRGLFYHHKSTVEIARELHCTSQNVGYIKRTALARLAEILKRRVV